MLKNEYRSLDNACHKMSSCANSTRAAIVQPLLGVILHIQLWLPSVTEQFACRQDEVLLAQFWQVKNHPKQVFQLSGLLSA